MKPDRTAALIAVVMLAAAGCDGPAATRIEIEELRLEVVAGSGQEGLPGQRLPELLTLRLTDQAGRPVAGATLRALTAGSAAGVIEPVIGESNAIGVMTARWTLGPDSLSAAADLVADRDGRSSNVVRLTASMLPIDRADVIRVLDPSVLPVRLVYMPVPDRVGAERQLLIADTIYHVVPDADRAPRSVVAFAAGRPPALLSKPGGSTPDTLTFTFGEPFELSLRIQIRDGHFPDRSAVARRHLERTEQIWAALPFGVRLGDVQIVDGTAGNPKVHYEGAYPCIGSASGPDPNRTRIDVLYIRSMDNYSGYACPGGYILLTRSADAINNLLAHELGHLFGLSHENWGPVNVMNPQSPGTQMTEGQIFQAVFDQRSIVNTVYGMHAPETRRACGGMFAVTSDCLPVGFQFQPQ